MALLDSEGFGMSTVASDFVTYGASTSITGSIATNGPLGDNYFISGSTQYNGLTKVFPSSPTTFFMGMRLSTNSLSPNITISDAIGNTQISLIINGSGVISVYRGNLATLLASTPSLAFPPNAWAYLEIGATIGSGTSGSFVIRVNQSIVLSQSGINTQGYTGDTVVNQFRIQTPQFGGGAFYVAHYYLCDNTGPAPWNTFLGDVRVQTILPVSNASVAFTPAVTGATLVTGTSGTAASRATGTTWLVRIQCTDNTSTLLALQASFSSALTGTAQMALYSDLNGAPNSLLATSATVTNPITGINTFAVSGSPTVTSQVWYWIAIAASAAMSINTNSSTVSYYSFTATYGASFPSTASAALTSGTASNASVLTGMQLTASNAYNVSNVPPVPATYYNADATVGAIDTFNTNGVAAGTQTVYGLQVKTIMSKSDTGARSGGNLLVSGGTTGTGTSVALSTSPVQFRTMFETDPNTGAQWTVAAANAAKPGYEVTS